MTRHRCLVLLGLATLACSVPSGISSPTPTARLSAVRALPTAPRVTPGDPVPPQGSDCPKAYTIKGYLGQLSEPVYRRPFDPGYRAIQPVTCFATEDDAWAAGYVSDLP